MSGYATASKWRNRDKYFTHWGHLAHKPDIRERYESRRGRAWVRGGYIGHRLRRWVRSAKATVRARAQLAGYSRRGGPPPLRKPLPRFPVSHSYEKDPYLRQRARWRAVYGNY